MTPEHPPKHPGPSPNIQFFRQRVHIYIYIYTSVSPCIAMHGAGWPEACRPGLSYFEPSFDRIAVPNALRAIFWRPERSLGRPEGSRSAPGAVRRAPRALLGPFRRSKWLRPQFSRVFSIILTPGDLLGSSPNGSGRLEEACRRPRAGSRRLPGGFEWLQERSEVASGRVKWLRVASRALEEAPQTSANQRELSQGNSKVLSTASSMD